MSQGIAFTSSSALMKLEFVRLFSVRIGGFFGLFWEGFFFRWEQSMKQIMSLMDFNSDTESVDSEKLLVLFG